MLETLRQNFKIQMAARLNDGNIMDTDPEFEEL